MYKQSKLLQSIDIDEDNNIPILCSSTYVLDENERCLFDDKTDLSFMFTLLPNKFIEICNFLDIICYENNDTSFSKEFITYVMDNLKEEINVIKYFMQNEIKCILLYNDNKPLVKFCIPEFYFLCLSEYKEEVIKHNRIDIYNLSHDKSEYYRYIHKYDNHLTFIVKETKQYNDYIITISTKLINDCNKSNNITEIKKVVEQGANVNIPDYHGFTPLHYASEQPNNLEVIKYLVEQGANIHLQNNYGVTSLHLVSNLSNTLELIQYLVEQSADVNLQDNNGMIALHFASNQYNNLEVIKYLVEHGSIINHNNITGSTELHIASSQSNNLDVVKYLVEHGTNVNLQNNSGSTALHYASKQKNNLEVVKYLVERCADVNLQDNDGYTALNFALQLVNNEEVINYLQNLVF